MSVEVLFDDQIFARQARGGISRYFVELMRAYRSNTTYDVEVGTPRLWTRNFHLLDADLGRRLPTGLGRRRRVLNAANWYHRVGRRPNVIHHTYYDLNYLRRPHKGTIRAITVYDMIPELYPEFFPLGNPHMDKRAFVEAADLIFCISQATKRDLVRVYGHPDASIVVTPLGVDNIFRPDVQRPKELPERYVLFVGNRGGYKDFSVFAEAFANCDLSEETKLLAVGGGPFGDGEEKFLASLGLAARAFRVDLGDTELARAYAHALCFVFPSRYEGFGLPTLEAMASGCPTILVASSAHPEVGGDAALYFSPGNVDELSRLVGELAAAPQRRIELRAAGLARASTFSWTATARRTATAYHDAEMD